MNLRDKLDRIFSIWIRVSHADFQGFVSCFTCELRLPWQEAQNGHFIRRAHTSVRYDEDNCRPQCRECNEFRGGMEESFEEHLRDDLGDEVVDALISRGRQEAHYGDDWYREKIREYTERLRGKGVIL